MASVWFLKVMHAQEQDSDQSVSIKYASSSLSSSWYVWGNHCSLNQKKAPVPDRTALALVSLSLHVHYIMNKSGDSGLSAPGSDIRSREAFQTNKNDSLRRHYVHSIVRKKISFVPLWDRPAHSTWVPFGKNAQETSTRFDIQGEILSMR